jgi:coenzyme F420-0:L-glutamate ligase/coenzyme F420-1:gamma-L-glutamate ligase
VDRRVRPRRAAEGAPLSAPEAGGPAPADVRCIAPDGIREVEAGADLAALVSGALGALEEGDVVVVSSKVVSKAEGRQVRAADREQAITDETVRVVATRRQPNGSLTRIVENRLGIVGAAAGVDASNVAEGTVLLLPEDPDASARALRAALQERWGVRVGVVVTDTLGRPWRVGQTDVAIGAAGIAVVDDLRGSLDAAGRRMDVTVVAVADEIAAMADLVKGKALNRPVALVRGLGRLVTDEDGPGARTLVRTGAEDMFRRGADEAYADGYREGYAEGSREQAGHTGDDDPGGAP